MSVHGERAGPKLDPQVRQTKVLCSLESAEENKEEKMIALLLRGPNTLRRWGTHSHAD